MIVDGWSFPETTTIVVRDLARSWRWRPCEVCGSRSSYRALLVVGGNERVVCVLAFACRRRSSR